MRLRGAGVKRSVRRCPLWLVGLGAACLILPATAASATLTSSSGQVTYNAAPVGETNRLTATRSGGNYVFTESGAVAIAAAAPCANLSAAVATCPATGIRDINISLGDLNDTGSYDASIGSPVEEVFIDGGPGNDTITAAGTVGGFLLGREGNDLITGDEADDDIRADEGNDTIVGGAGADIVFDGPGADTVDAGPGSDRFFGGIDPDPGDVLDGGSGLDDSIDLRQRTGPLNINLNGLADDGEPGENDNLIGIEEIDSGEGDDTLTGGPEPNSLSSGTGDDALDGGPGQDFLFADQGADTISGGDGPDTIIGGGGGDQLVGGEGDDVFFGEFFDDGADAYSGEAGTDTITEIGDLLGRAVRIDLDGVADDGPAVPLEETPLDNAGADVENLIVAVSDQGEDGQDIGADDILTGNNSANQIDGGAGNDRINGLGGPDALLGDAGDDFLNGGPGIDSLDGAGGVDRLRTRDRSPDEASCGSASDILLADQLDDFSVACDRSSTGALLKSRTARLKKGRAKLTVSCPAAEGIDCKVKLTASKGRKTLATGAGTVKSGKTSKVTLKLTGAGRKARSKKLNLRTRTVFTDATGAKVTTTVPKLVLSR